MSTWHSHGHLGRGNINRDSISTRLFFRASLWFIFLINDWYCRAHCRRCSPWPCDFGLRKKTSWASPAGDVPVSQNAAQALSLGDVFPYSVNRQCRRTLHVNRWQQQQKQVTVYCISFSSCGSFVFKYFLQHKHAVPTKSRRWHWTPRNWSYS